MRVATLLPPPIASVCTGGHGPRQLRRHVLAARHTEGLQVQGVNGCAHMQAPTAQTLQGCGQPAANAAAPAPRLPLCCSRCTLLSCGFGSVWPSATSVDVTVISVDPAGIHPYGLGGYSGVVAAPKPSAKATRASGLSMTPASVALETMALMFKAIGV